MDSKMDSGYLAPGETLEDDYDVLRELLPEEVLGIMDQLLCHEVGASRLLAVTVQADTRCRWPGTWVIHFLKRFLRLYISTNSYGRSRKSWSRLRLLEPTDIFQVDTGYIQFYERTACL